MYGNNPHSTGRGRYPTAAYKRWKQQAGEALLAQRQEKMLGKQPLRALIIHDLSRRSDIDNYQKAIFDLLQEQEVIEDDRWVDDLQVLRSPDIPWGCYVEVGYL